MQDNAQRSTESMANMTKNPISRHRSSMNCLKYFHFTVAESILDIQILNYTKRSAIPEYLPHQGIYTQKVTAYSILEVLAAI